MNRHGARVLLVVSCLLAAAAVFQSFRFSQSNQSDRNRLLHVERSTGELLLDVAEIRAAQMAYLATGQGPEFWMRRATEVAGGLESNLAALRGTLESQAAQSSLDAASGAVGALVELDGRARQALETDRPYLASDLIFTDGVTSASAITEAVESVRANERTAVEARLDRDRIVQLALFPAALVLVLISAWLAGSARRRSPARSEAEEVAQMLRELPPPVKGPGVATAPAPPVATAPGRPPAAPAADAPVVAPQPADPVRTISLPDMAELCVDLARVIDARDMPALLQRAARALDAKGVIVWVVDTGGARLTPALAHGYPDRVLAKLGTLDVEADNVTSLAFRSTRPQSMPGTGNPGTSSAIAVPLVTTDGCNGVLSAEVPGAAPTADGVAVARILAAQLATMLTPLEPSAQQAAEG